MIPVLIWFLLHILTSVTAGMVSSIKPMTPLEKAIPFLPPSAPLGQWFERVFLSPWTRWDALWYQSIVTRGYTATDGTAQFHPLYPFLAVPIARLGLSPSLSLLLVSSLAGIAAYWFFFKLAQFDLSRKDAIFALMVFALAPPAFILFAPYSEALFILTSILCMLFLLKKSWWLAGLMGALAVLTRQQGVFLLVPMVWELWESSGRSFSNLRSQWRDWLALSLIPAGLLIWLIYRATILNDLHASFTSLQEIIYSIIISPSAEKVVAVQRFVWPWLSLRYFYEKLVTAPDIDIWVNVILGAVFLVLLTLTWTRMRMSYRLFSLVIVLVSLSYYTGPIHPYMGLPRHMYLAFPIFIGMAMVVKNRWLRLTLIGISGISQLLLLVLFILQTWIP
jgi:Gpi18-like mannosyltransferase